MFLRRKWHAVFDYVQSELLYSSLSSSPSSQLKQQTPQQQQQSQQSQKPSGSAAAPASATFSPPPPDPQLLTHFQQRERVYAFIKVPLSLERFMFFACWLCVDTFLSMFTFLPIRIIFCAFKFLSRLPGFFFDWKSRLSPAQRCDFLRGVVVLFCSAVVCQLDISVFYHLIRSQSIIKLYIFFNMLEIAEKLMTSVGQDIMDALFITATEHAFHKSKSRHLVLIFHVVLAIIYSCIHTVIFMLQAVTLNVAFNSQNKSLLTVMMSNNFVEIKSNVFRKYSRNNLYQVACYDAKERFHLVVMMSIVALRNTAQFHWQLDHLMALLPDMAIVLMAEVFVDWIKHCFITKFNETSSELYTELRTSLARHVLTASVVSGGADRQDTVANRTGLSLVPLTCLVIVVCMQAFRNADWGGAGPLVLVLVLLGVLVLKSILGCIVIAAARAIVCETSTGIVHHASSRSIDGHGGNQGRSFSVENVKFESTSQVASPYSTASKLAEANNALKKLSPKENVENTNPVNQLSEIDLSQSEMYTSNYVKTLPALAALRSSWPLYELRRTRSLTTIPESSQLTIPERPNSPLLSHRKFIVTTTEPENSSHQVVNGVANDSVSLAKPLKTD